MTEDINNNSNNNSYAFGCRLVKQITIFKDNEWNSLDNEMKRTYVSCILWSNWSVKALIIKDKNYLNSVDKSNNNNNNNTNNCL